MDVRNISSCSACSAGVCGAASFRSNAFSPSASGATCRDTGHLAPYDAVKTYGFVRLPTLRQLIQTPASFPLCSPCLRDERFSSLTTAAKSARPLTHLPSPCVCAPEPRRHPARDALQPSLNAHPADVLAARTSRSAARQTPANAQMPSHSHPTYATDSPARSQRFRTVAAPCPSETYPPAYCAALTSAAPAP